MLRPGMQLPSLFNSIQWAETFLTASTAVSKIYKAQPPPKGKMADIRELAALAVAWSTYCTDLKRGKKISTNIWARWRTYVLNLIQFYNHKGQLLFCLVSFYLRTCRIRRLCKLTESVFWLLTSHCVSTLLLITGMMSWLAGYKGSINWLNESQSKYCHGGRSQRNVNVLEGQDDWCKNKWWERRRKDGVPFLQFLLFFHRLFFISSSFMILLFCYFHIEGVT